MSSASAGGMARCYLAPWEATRRRDLRRPPSHPRRLRAAPGLRRAARRGARAPAPDEGETMSTAAHEVPTAPSPRKNLRVDPLVGEILGKRYVIGGLIGRGGMGRVYEGHDLVRDQGVAVKVLP